MRRGVVLSVIAERALRARARARAGKKKETLLSPWRGLPTLLPCLRVVVNFCNYM